MSIYKNILRITLLSLAISPVIGAGFCAAEQSIGEKNTQTKSNQANALDDLFARLKNEPNQESASIIAKGVIKKIRQSNNKTVELLMSWSDEAYLQRNDIGTALDLLDQITVIDPNYAEGWNRRATLYFEQGKLGLSLKDVERTLAIEPRHFGALTGLAMILEQIGYQQKAQEAWRAVLEVYPANQRAQSAYIRLLEETAPIKH